MKKFGELLFIIVLALTYVFVYDLSKVRSDSECKMDVELRNIQIESFIKSKKGFKK